MAEKMPLLLLLLAVIGGVSAVSTDSNVNFPLVKKCCGKDEVLDAGSLACLPSEGEETLQTRLKPSYMLNLTSSTENVGQALMSANLKSKQMLYNQMVVCHGKHKLLDLTKPLEYLISTSGELVSLAGQYEIGQPLGDFCIDLALPVGPEPSGRVFRAALICDPCQGDKMCLRTCCSHLQVGTVDENTGRILCSNPDGGPSLQSGSWKTSLRSEEKYHPVVMVHK